MLTGPNIQGTILKQGCQGLCNNAKVFDEFLMVARQARKLRNSLTDVGTGQSAIACTLIGSVATP